MEIASRILIDPRYLEQPDVPDDIAAAIRTALFGPDGPYHELLNEMASTYSGTTSAFNNAWHDIQVYGYDSSSFLLFWPQDEYCLRPATSLDRLNARLMGQPRIKEQAPTHRIKESDFARLFTGAILLANADLLDRRGQEKRIWRGLRWLWNGHGFERALKDLRASYMSKARVQHPRSDEMQKAHEQTAALIEMFAGVKRAIKDRDATMLNHSIWRSDALSTAHYSVEERRVWRAARPGQWESLLQLAAMLAAGPGINARPAITAYWQWAVCTAIEKRDLPLVKDLLLDSPFITSKFRPTFQQLNELGPELFHLNERWRPQLIMQAAADLQKVRILNRRYVNRRYVEVPQPYQESHLPGKHLIHSEDSTYMYEDEPLRTLKELSPEPRMHTRRLQMMSATSGEDLLSAHGFRTLTLLRPPARTKQEVLAQVAWLVADLEKRGGVDPQIAREPRAVQGLAVVSMYREAWEELKAHAGTESSLLLRTESESNLTLRDKGVIRLSERLGIRADICEESETPKAGWPYTAWDQSITTKDEWEKLAVPTHWRSLLSELNDLAQLSLDGNTACTHPEPISFSAQDLLAPEDRQKLGEDELAITYQCCNRCGEPRIGWQLQLPEKIGAKSHALLMLLASQIAPQAGANELLTDPQALLDAFKLQEQAHDPIPLHLECGAPPAADLQAEIDEWDFQL